MTYNRASVSGLVLFLVFTVINTENEYVTASDETTSKLRCFACNSERNSTCGPAGNFTFPESAAIVCLFPGPCLYRIKDTENKTTYQRLCPTAGQKPMTAGCKSSKMFSANVTNCWCFSDYCNGMYGKSAAVKRHTNPYTLITAILVGYCYLYLSVHGRNS